MPIDIGLIAAAAAPYLAKGADAFSKTAGEKLGGKVVELCQTIENKFKGNAYAEETLARAKEKPESDERQAALKGVLAEKMEEDSDFAQNVSNLVKEVQKESGQARTIFNQQGQMVHASQTNIGGDVHGPVFSGSFSGPVNIGKPK